MHDLNCSYELRGIKGSISANIRIIAYLNEITLRVMVVVYWF